MYQEEDINERTNGVITYVEVPKKVLSAMNPVEFKDAVDNRDEKVLKPYYDYAKVVCYSALKKRDDVPNIDPIISAAANHAVLEMYNKLALYNKSKGASFSSFFFKRIQWSLSETLSDYGISAAVKLKEAKGDCANMSDRDTYSSQDEDHVRVFSENMMPYVREFADTLPPIKKKILMAKWGAAIDPATYAAVGANASTYGYATALSQQFASMGINKTPKQIKQMLYDILQQLGEYLVKETGISRKEFGDNLQQFILADKTNPLKDKVRSLLQSVDVNDMSDDEAAWIFMQFFR